MSESAGVKVLSSSAWNVSFFNDVCQPLKVNLVHSFLLAVTVCAQLLSVFLPGCMPHSEACSGQGGLSVRVAIENRDLCLF